MGIRNIVETVFDKDIVLDEAAFERAVEDFASLSVQLQNLRSKVEEMLNILREGFDTPAGRQFIASCERNLFEPLDDQKLVIEHISQTLQQSKQTYASVFEEYESLQNVINSQR